MCSWRQSPGGKKRRQSCEHKWCFWMHKLASAVRTKREKQREIINTAERRNWTWSHEASSKQSWYEDPTPQTSLLMLKDGEIQGVSAVFPTGDGNVWQTLSPKATWGSSEVLKNLLSKLKKHGLGSSPCGCQWLKPLKVWARRLEKKCELLPNL